jgi:hypothetical protein
MSFFTRKRWFFLLVAVLSIASPGISYAQLGDLKGKAVETLTNNVMKELDKKFADMVAKEALSDAAKSTIVKELSEISRPIVKQLIDNASSGRLPNPATLVTSVINNVTPRLQSLVTASLTGAATDAVTGAITGSITQTPGQAPTDAQTPGQTPGQTPAPAPAPPPRTSPPAITIADIQGVTVPVIGSKLGTTITETAQYRGTVKWSPDTFALNEPWYTATITLTPKTGYSFEGTAADFFKVSGTTSVRNAAGSGVITAVFPGTMTISNPSISGVTAPSTGAIPLKIIETDQYWGNISWSPDVYGRFEQETRYTATIIISPKPSYTLEGIKEDFFSVPGAEKVSNIANAAEVIARFPATKEVKTVHLEDKKFWSIGASAGSAFPAPLVVGTVHGTLAPLSGLFIDVGADAGYGINTSIVKYYSIYPFVNFGVFVPFPRLKADRGGGWYAGTGLGAMIASYTFDSAGEIGKTIIAMNVVTGFNILDMIDLSLTVRTDFKSVNNKLAVGYVYRFN